MPMRRYRRSIRAPGIEQRASTAPGERDGEMWEIELDGTVVRTRAGHAGETPREETYRFRSDLRAHWEVDRQCAEREAEGFELVERDERLPTLSHKELDRALAGDPDNIDSYLVYGDWLQSQGDPRGELIALQHALMNEPARSEQRKVLEQREVALLSRHRRHLWGVLGEHVVSNDAQLYAADLFTVEWRLGFVRSATLELLDLDLDLGLLSFAQLLTSFFALDSARMLEALHIVERGTRDPHIYRDIITAIAERAPSTLRSLSVGDPDDSWRHIRRLQLPVAGPGLAGLRRLVVCADDLTIMGRFPPVIEHLAIHTGASMQDIVTIVAQTEWRALEALSLCLLRERIRYHDVRFDATPLSSLLGGVAAPRLTSLALHGTADTDAICQQIAGGRLARQLQHLDLAHGLMTATGANYLLYGSLDSLDSLAVHNNQLDSGSIQRLANRFRKVHARPQQAIDTAEG